jgi:uncharacterized membrane protein
VTNSHRIEALTDGIFAIAATLLVLEIRVPELDEQSMSKMSDSLVKILPSLIAFVFSFLNILIFWANHDVLGKTLKHFDSRLIYMNIIFLLFISLIPFTTAFISRYPFNIISVTVYGSVLFFSAMMASAMYFYIAFRSELMYEKISLKTRMKVWKRIRSGPLLFAVAIPLGFLSVYIPIAIYILVPIIFLIFPKIEFE